GVEATGRVPKPSLAKLVPPRGGTHEAERPARPVYWVEVGDWVETRVFDGERLGPGHRFEGPAVVEYPGTTVAVPPGAHVDVDEYGNLRMRLGSSGGSQS